MKKLIPPLVVALALFASVAVKPIGATIIFFDNFNDGAANTPLTGRTAVSGQTWAGSGFGQSSMLMTTGSGQGGTLGVGSTSGAGGADNVAPLGQTLTSGAYVYEADFSVLDARPRNQLFLFGPGFAGSNVSFGMDHGGVFFEGVYFGHANVPTGFATNAVGYNIHVAVTFNVDTLTGSVSWFDIDNPSNVSTSGNVSLGSFTNPGGGVGSYAFSQILVSESPPAAGFDNVSFSSVPEPSTLLLVGMLSFVAMGFARRKDRQST